MFIKIEKSCNYNINYKMELLPWIDVSKLHIPSLNQNENAVDYLYQHLELFDFHNIIQNPSFKILPVHLQQPNIYPYIFLNPQPGIENILKDLDFSRLEWSYMCRNPRCIDLIQENQKFVYAWESLCVNPKAIHILLKNMIHIDWTSLCLNPCKEAVDLLMQFPNKIDWLMLSSNPFAIDILRKNPDKINYWGLCWNYNAIDLIEKHMAKKDCGPVLSWMGLSQNKNAIHILEKNQHKIDWNQLSLNPSIFHYNYKRLTVERMNILREEMMQITCHPSKIEYWLKNGLSIEDLPD
jgi:hypothetical protein